MTPWESRGQSAWWVPGNFSVISFHFRSLSLRERNIPFSRSVSQSLSLCMETFVITNSHSAAPPSKAVKKCRFYWFSSLYSFWVFVGHKSLQLLQNWYQTWHQFSKSLKTFMAGIYKLIDWAFDTTEYWIFFIFYFLFLSNKALWHQFSKSWRLLWPEFTSSLIELLTQLSTGFFFFLSNKALTLFSSISA